MTSPRPYIAAAAASVLAALYFVPSATAEPVHSAPAHSAASRQTTTTADGSDQDLGGLADTGAVDTEPYVIGGAAFLAAGAGLVLNARRRSRDSLV
ncbi:hypothetical protein [Actinacidiphila sp. ITFR-21]|uniref:hypothetical protein n=1 Tax=Actinacidiphila sp. ITFR-21 TaxID=3075199 RepID=UPI00288928D8|nr:hypothetical protein [Streptomyces sp. ITFR-21]WNI17441.1 hypothetical protein RLT57_19255 [Streptomyces sp. ITFR-21]